MGYGVAARGAARDMMRTMGNSGSAMLSKIDESIGKSPISRVTSPIWLIWGVSVLLRCAFILIPLIKENLKTIFEQQNKEKQKNMKEDVLPQNIGLGDSQQLKKPLLLHQVEQEQSCTAKFKDQANNMDQADKDKAIMKDIRHNLYRSINYRP